jgi:hypothetical protein
LMVLHDSIPGRIDILAIGPPSGLFKSAQ